MNIAAALRWIGSRRGQSVLLMDFLRDLHQRMFGDTWHWAGTFRKTIKTIGVPPEQIQEQLRNLLADTQHQIDNGVLSPMRSRSGFITGWSGFIPFPMAMVVTHGC